MAGRFVDHDDGREEDGRILDDSETRRHEVIMYGANEAGWLATVRAANPNGACLVVSPLDQVALRSARD